MDVKYVHRTTLIDFPGCIAAIVFTGGCNFSCNYCYNQELVFKPNEIPSISLYESLKMIQSLKYIDGIVITGGEPTSQKNLKMFIELVKETTNLKIKLDTNGYNFDSLKDVLDLVDYVAIDLKSSFSTYNEVVCKEVDTSIILESIRLVQNSNIKHELRTTLWQNHHLLESYTEIIDIIRDSNYFIQNFYSNLENSYEPLTKNQADCLKQKLEEKGTKVFLRGDYY